MHCCVLHVWPGAFPSLRRKAITFLLTIGRREGHASSRRLLREDTCTTCGNPRRSGIHGSAVGRWRIAMCRYARHRLDVSPLLGLGAIQERGLQDYCTPAGSTDSEPAAANEGPSPTGDLGATINENNWERGVNGHWLKGANEVFDHCSEGSIVGEFEKFKC